MKSRRGLALTLALALIALTGCETTAEKSARLAKQAKRVTVNDRGLTITHESALVHVLQATLVHNSERTAAVVTLHNRSAHALHSVPIAITIKDGHGRTVFQNNGPGLESALVSVPSIAAHANVVWVDDQLSSAGRPESVSARIGEAPTVASALPKLAVSDVRLSEDPASGLIATGTVANRSHVPQRSLVVFAIARRSGRVVAAGRAIVPELVAGASAPFQIAFAGEARGARLEVLVPPTSFG
jgi:hypothetical protein